MKMEIMITKFKNKYRQEGRDAMLGEVITKFEELYDQYYAQGDSVACDLTVDMVAYLQDDAMQHSAKIEAGRER